jgi:hypothetical protein
MVDFFAFCLEFMVNGKYEEIGYAQDLQLFASTIFGMQKI